MKSKLHLLIISSQDKLATILGGITDITITKTTYNDESTIEITY